MAAMGRSASKIFIICSPREEEFSRALKELIERWLPGLEVSYCRESERLVSPNDRPEPIRKIRESVLVISVLSREFQYSQHCQSMAGVAAALENSDPDSLKHLAILVAPATQVCEICPVLSGTNHIEASDPRTVTAPHRFVSDLKSQFRLQLDLDLFRFQGGAGEEMKRVELALASIIDGYRISPARRVTSEVWDSIDWEKDPLAADSIVENIKKSLRDPSHDTEVALVGVSLKYSTLLLDRALDEFSGEDRDGIRAKKKLRIRLVYMDDNSHILYALHDQKDIQSIRDTLFKEDQLVARWIKCLEGCPIDLEKPETTVIDYIPPRIGILIDDQVLYAGRCAFEDLGGNEFRILVGEREYFYYMSGDPRGRGAKMIEEFKSYLRVYGTQRLNGIELVEDRDEWVERLVSCVLSHAGVKEITLIAQTFTKFMPLVEVALKNGIDVKLYAQRPLDDLKLQPAQVRKRIESLEARIRERVPYLATAKARIYYVDELPTFRAALIGGEMLGIQMYLPANPKMGRDRDPSSVRVIATRYSSRFDQLREELVEGFLKNVVKIPVTTIQSATDALLELTTPTVQPDAPVSALPAGVLAMELVTPSEFIMEPSTRPRIFVSYSHHDSLWLEFLRKALAQPLSDEEFFLWSDKEIGIGDDWKEEIERNLASADVAILLVTLDFFNSKFIREEEFPRMLDAAEKKGLKIFWVAVGDSLFDRTPLRKYQCVNDPSHPLKLFTGGRRESELVKIARKIVAALLSRRR